MPKPEGMMAAIGVSIHANGIAVNTAPGIGTVVASTAIGAAATTVATALATLRTDMADNPGTVGRF